MNFRRRNTATFFAIPAFLLGMASVTAIADDAQLRTDAKETFSPVPAPKAAKDKTDAALIELGKALYFDTRLSRSQAISCNSCHNLATSGVDNHQTSLGHGWHLGGRNSPTVLNSSLNTTQFWDGRAKDLAEQAGGPPLNPVEMAHSEEGVVDNIKGVPGYAPMFKAAFPGVKDPITYANITKAIARFEETLTTPDSPFDKWLKGDDNAMSEQAKRGLSTFMEVGCSSCHFGAGMGGDGFFEFGVVEAPSDEVRPPADKGRAAVTGDESDNYAFKPPLLRNIALTAPYFHSGAVWKLDDAVRIMASAQLGEELTPEQVKDIVAFLNAQNGVQPQITLPQLPPRVADTPKPDVSK